ncbi:alpha/beta-hydrolase [Heliocybe sulcata]|uniref:Palmitoyl-protein thioesterase 1 n=1 Tax=Heliocybe sulcata TaxID=5364 RepID=A0A5C3NDH7_9AGAM|nr:alpha/beta-hydrolase [Heliocybe sulcata]
MVALALGLLALCSQFLSFSQAGAYPASSHSHANVSVLSKPRPLVLWHGLGDSHSSPGMMRFADEVKAIHEGIFVHSIYITEDLDEDRKAGWFGNISAQLELVVDQLNNIEELKDGFDAMGFSQGGQFLRAYVERYNSPPIHNLITFGSQHMGVADMPMCEPGPGYVWCRLARRMARGGVYGAWAQANLIQAQYYRDPDQLPVYLSRNHFMPDINNELPEDYGLSSSSMAPITGRNKTYAKNLQSLNKFIMVLFTEDKTVVPKESSWFGSYAPSDSLRTGDGGEGQVVLAEKTIIPMRMQPVYTTDAIGLRTLDERGDVLLETCEGEHMVMNRVCWEGLVKEWVGGST